MNIAIITAAGQGKRMSSTINKILLTLHEKPIIYHTLKKFEDHPEIDEVILVVNENTINQTREVVAKNNFSKIKNVILGGEHRQDSVFNGLRAIEHAKDDDVIIIHNGVNPMVTAATISNVIAEAKNHKAAVAALPARDTIKEVDDGFVKKTLDRSTIWMMQTPQAIQYSLAMKAFQSAAEENFYATDDVALVEKLGEKVKIVECFPQNTKITTQEDLQNMQSMMKVARVGLGQDSHRFTNGKKPLLLGGIHFTNEQGLEANSDGDVILHALVNAISQAIGGSSLGNIADPLYKQGVTDSKEYVKVILKEMDNKNFSINNIGIMVEAKKPRFEGKETAVKEKVAALCKLTPDKVGLTITSGEGLSDFGKGLGIQSFAVVTLKQK